MNKLFFGDNLEVLRSHIEPSSVDLIYLDPPFNSNANYNVLFGAQGRASEAQVEAFRDTWSWEDAARDAYQDVIERGDRTSLLVKGLRPFLGDSNIMAYIVMMAVRLIELERVLKPTGSIYLHCDPVASHYLKIVIDSIFGPENFRSEIIWRRSGSHNSTTRQFGPVHDCILFATKSDRHKLREVFTSHNKGYIESEFRFSDVRGIYRLNEIMGPGTRHGESGEPWRGYNPGKAGRHWAIPETLKVLLRDNGQGMTTQQQLDELDGLGELYISPSGRPKYKQRPSSGVPLQDIWAFQPGTEGCLWNNPAAIDNDVKWLSNERERLGYPTQKPIGLLERIIRSSSDPGDVILDPFCGCGTTIEAAKNLGRQWIGIDVTHYAITLIEKRLAKSGISASEYKVSGRPMDLAGARDLAARDKHQFQWWAAWRLGAQTYREEKKGPDRGIDGNIFFANGPYGTGRIIISVKGGGNVGVAMVRDLRGVIEREDAEMGVLITLENPTSPMASEAAAAGFVRKSAHGRLPRIQIVTIEEILDGRTPKLPPLPAPSRQSTGYRRKKHPGQIEMLLPFEGLDIKPAKGEFVDPRFMQA